VYQETLNVSCKAAATVEEFEAQVNEVY